MSQQNDNTVVKTIRFTQTSLDKAEELVKDKGFKSFSDLVQYLLMREIEDYEKTRKSSPQ